MSQTWSLLATTRCSHPTSTVHPVHLDSQTNLTIDMLGDPPTPETTNTRSRHWVTDVEVSPGNADPNCKFSARIFVDDELVCNLPWIDHTRPLRWSGLLLCDVSPSSKVALRLCKSTNGRPRYFNFPPYTVSELDAEFSEVPLELPEAAWVVTIKYLTRRTAEELFPNELDEFNAIEGTYNSLEPDATVKYLFKSALQFASFVAEWLPECNAKLSFLICMKAWELLDQHSQLDDTVPGILCGLNHLRDIVETMSQASSSMLATSMNRSKEPIEDILALLEDISVYIFNRCGTNCLANISREDSQPNDAYDIEAYKIRLEDLQKAFYASWSPAATSGTDPTPPAAADNEPLELPSQDEQITLDESTRRADPYEMLNLLRPTDPSGYDLDQSCLDGTREAVLSRIITWSQNRDNGESFLWISGPAGMGKTSVATSLCQRLDNIHALAGSFFCRRDDPDSSEPLRLINNLIHAIAIQLPSFAQEVANTIRRSRSICTSHLSLRYDRLVKGPLERLRPLTMHKTLVVVIDGLDECGDRDSREKLLHKLYDTSQLVPWLKIIISGRPVGDIQQFFQDYCSHEPIIHLETYDASDDIRAYIQGQLGQLTQKENWPHDSIKQLCNMAQGVFLWATLAARYIKKSILPALPRLRKILNNQKSPVTNYFDAMYTRALKTAIDDDNDEIKDAHLRCIGAILAISECRPLTTPDLQQLLLVAGRIDRLTLEQTIKNLKPLLVVMDGARIRFLHASFRDFITNFSRSGEFHVVVDRYRAEPTARCLEVMQRDLRFNICELETSHLLNSEVPDLKARIQSHIGPALKYACAHWIDHFPSSPNQSLVGATKKFLEGPHLMYWIEALSLLGCLDVAITGLRKLASLKPASRDLGLIISWARDAHRFLLSFYDAIVASTPHLYVSALAFAPYRSLTVERMRPYFPNTVTIAGGPGSAWHPCVKSILHPQPIQSLSISPDGLRIAVGYSNGSLAIWDLKTGTRLSESLEGHTDSVTCVVYSPNSHFIVSSSEDTTIRVWAVASRLQTSTMLTGHSGPVHAIAFSPDTTIIASGSSDMTIRLWDSTMRPIHGPYVGHSSRVSSVAFSSDGAKLVSGSWDKTIRVWAVNIGSRRLVDIPLVITGHSDSITRVALSPDGLKLASSAKDGTIQICNPQTGEKAKSCTTSTKHFDSITSISFSPNGSRIISASLDGAIHLYDATTLERIALPFGHSSSINGIAFSPDGALIVSGSTDMTARVWEISKCPTEKPMTTTLIIGNSAVNCVAVSRNGTLLTSSSGDNTLRMWDAQTGAQIGDPFFGHSAYVYSVAISPDSTRIVSSSDDHTVKLWDTTTHFIISSHQHNTFIPRAIFSPDGTIIAFGSGDNNIYLWDPTGRKLVGNPLQAHSDMVMSVAFSPDGACLASASGDCTLILWDTKTHSRLGQPFSGHTNRIRSVSFSPCGTQLVSGSEDNTARLWDRQTGNTIYTLTGHTYYIHAVAFSPGGSYIASGSHDNTVRLWNVKTGQLIQQPLAGHTRGVNSVTFSHDGNYVISGSDDNTIRAWGLGTSCPVAEQPNGPPGTYCWPTNPYELVSHSHHPGWVTHDQRSLAFWLPLYYQKPEQFRDTHPHSEVSRSKTFLDYSKFVHGTAWTAVASGSANHDPE